MRRSGSFVDTSYLLVFTGTPHLTCQYGITTVTLHKHSYARKLATIEGSQSRIKGATGSAVTVSRLFVNQKETFHCYLNESQLIVLVNDCMFTLFS
jgi:hypothetical protein